MKLALKEIADSIHVCSRSSYLYNNHLYREKPSLSHRISSPYCIRLSELLYQIYHCRIQNPEDIPHRYVYSSDTRDFESVLSKNNTSRGTWESHWKIVDKEGDFLIASNDKLCLWIHPSLFVTAKGNEPHIGSHGFVWMPKEHFRLFPDYYFVYGEATFVRHSTDIITRIYWNIPSFVASTLVKEITTKLNRQKIPFHFKILNNPSSFIRTDAAVLYITRKYYALTRQEILNIYSRLKNTMNFDTSLFAKRLAPGLSVAEELKNDVSFGLNRSMIIAEGLYNARRKNRTSIEDKINEIEVKFSEYELDIDRPYLNPESTDIYEF